MVYSKDDIYNWLKKNELSPEDFSDDKTEFIYGIKRGSVKLVVVRNNDEECVKIKVRFPIIENIRNNPENQAKFGIGVNEKGPSLNADVSLSESQYFVSDTIYDDGFSYDQLFRSIRNVTMAGVCLLQFMYSLVGVEDSPKASDILEENQDYYI